MGSNGMHPTLAKNKDADTEGRVTVYSATLTTRKQLWSLLGHAGYYRKFVWEYALITTPLRDLFTQGVWFSWDETCRENMYLVVRYLRNKPVLGEDAQKAQVFDPSIAGMWSAQGM